MEPETDKWKRRGGALAPGGQSLTRSLEAWLEVQRTKHPKNF